MKMKTTVINVRGRNRQELLADPNFVYVGPAAPWADWEDSGLANPFGENSNWKAATAALYFERWLAQDDSVFVQGETMVEYFPETIRAALPSLRGKVLGCWCCDWDGTGEPSATCRAVVLARLADGPMGDGVGS